MHNEKQCRRRLPVLAAPSCIAASWTGYQFSLSFVSCPLSQQVCLSLPMGLPGNLTHVLEGASESPRTPVPATRQVQHKTPRQVIKVSTAGTLGLV